MTMWPPMNVSTPTWTKTFVKSKYFSVFCFSFFWGMTRLSFFHTVTMKVPNEWVQQLIHSMTTIAWLDMRQTLRRRATLGQTLQLFCPTECEHGQDTQFKIQERTRTTLAVYLDRQQCNSQWQLLLAYEWHSAWTMLCWLARLMQIGQRTTGKPAVCWERKAPFWTCKSIINQQKCGCSNLGNC